MKMPDDPAILAGTDAAVADTTSRDGLIALLLDSYPELKRRLALRLGSMEASNDALQDTYLRLRRAEGLGPIRNPRSYLFRMAINLASNRKRSNARYLTAAEIETLIDVPDDAPDPARVAEARSELAAVDRALHELPPRRRDIFRRAWVGGANHDAIAAEFGIAVRTVRHEIHLATRHLHRATQEISAAELQFRLSKVSSR